MKQTLLLVALAVILAAPALAFHDGGVAHCNGCHTMHNSQDNAEMNDDGTGAGGSGQAFGYDDLLLFEKKSDVCLDCHGASYASYGVWSASPTAPTKFNSAGDFVFLTEDNLNDGHAGSASSNWIDGDAAGHNIDSNIKNTTWDTTLDAPPGDPALVPLTNNEIACSSCHDPHGNDSFRLLYRKDQVVDVGGEAVTYNETLNAFGVSVFGGMPTNDNHNAYVSNYSAWCSSCHEGFHEKSGGTDLLHPSGELINSLAAVYNAYDGTTDWVTQNNLGNTGIVGTGGRSTAYLEAVPFEDPDHTAGDRTSTVGPDSSNSQVSCVTCHRAHATSAPDSGRWDFNVTLLDEDGDESGSYALLNPYDANQRSLCNKCHAQDEYDHIN